MGHWGTCLIPLKFQLFISLQIASEPREIQPHNLLEYGPFF